MRHPKANSRLVPTARQEPALHRVPHTSIPVRCRSLPAAQPGFEHEQVPQSIAVIDSAIDMVVYHALNNFDTEILVTARFVV